MSKQRARYVGYGDAVTVTWPPAAVYPEKTWTVERGHWLPDDAPAKLVAELVKSPDWSEIEQSSTSNTKKED